MSDEQISLFCFFLCFIILVAAATPNRYQSPVANEHRLDLTIRPNNFEPFEECTCLDHTVLVQKGRKNPCPCQDGDGKGCVCEECSCKSCVH